MLATESLTTSGETHAAEGNPSSTNPFDRAGFLARIQTYRPSTWFAKPAELSPVVCSRFGWVNTNRNILRCTACGACASFDIPASCAGDQEIVENYVRSLRTSHAPHCPWCTAECPKDFERVQSMPRQQVLEDLVARMEALGRVWDLPVLENSLSAELNRYPTLKEKFGHLLKWNLNRTKEECTAGESSKNDAASAPVVDRTSVSEEAWQKRNEKLLSLALMGWRVKELSSKVYLKDGAEQGDKQNVGAGNKRKRAWREVYAKDGNPNKGYILSRETILYCNYCAARVGGWSFKTEPGIDLSKFQRIFARNVMRAKALKKNKTPSSEQPDKSLEQGVASKTKEVKKDLMGTIAGGVASKFSFALDKGVFGSASAQSLFGFGRSSEKKEQGPSLESLLAQKSDQDNFNSHQAAGFGSSETMDARTPLGDISVPPPVCGKDNGNDEASDDQPVFGLSSYKKRNIREAPPVESELIEKGMMEILNDDRVTNIMPEDYAEVVEGAPFDPIGCHRYFCPYLVGWEAILKSVVD